MLRNYLITAARNLLRNALTTVISVVGLSVGLAAALFAGLYLRDELTYDSWVPGHERIFDVVTTLAPFRGTSPIEMRGALNGVARDLKADFPQIAFSARVSLIRELKVERDNVTGFEPSFAWVDPDFFSVVPLKAIAGDLQSALVAPDGAVITREIALKYFGRLAPIGEPFVVSGGHMMRVGAVIEDWPSNSSFGSIRGFLSARASFSATSIADAKSYGPETEPFAFPSSHTYFRLHEGVDGETLAHEMPAFVARHFDKKLMGDITLRLRPLASVHLDPAGPRMNGGSDGPDPTAMLYAVATIALLIVFVAGVNFVNLMTARSLKRAVEVGTRKTAGAMRHHLIAQFMGEALLYACIGMAAAIVAVILCLPSFNGFLGRDIRFDPFASPMLAVGVVVVAGFVGASAGFYPALVLSRFAPAVVLRRAPLSAAAGGGIRNALVVIQFAVLIGLALVTLVVVEQTRFAMSESLRFDKDQVLIVDRSCTPALKAAIGDLPGTRGVACSWSSGGGVSVERGYISAVQIADRTIAEMGIAPLDFGFFELYGMKPIAGRFFSQDHGVDIASPTGETNPSVVINESALRQLGFESPEAAVGQTILWRRMLPAREALDRRPLLPSQIIGVVPDVSIRAARVPSRPVFYYADMAMHAPEPAAGYGAQSLNIKLAADQVPETLDAIDRLWGSLGDPNRPVSRRFVDEWLRVIYLDVIRQGQLFGGFAGVTLFLAALGLFGLAAFSTEQRTKEIGVRKSMGASSRDILGLMLWQFAKPVLLANVIAWPAAYLFMRRWLEGFAYHIDLAPWMFLGASAAALLIALTTVIGHALLVARAHPVTALRYE